MGDGAAGSVGAVGVEEAEAVVVVVAAVERGGGLGLWMMLGGLSAEAVVEDRMGRAMESGV